MLSKYKFMEINMSAREQNLNDKIPELKKTIIALGRLSNREPMVVDFELHSTLYSRARVVPQNVFLWLGANVMLEYEVKEAKEMIALKLKTAHETLKQVQEDIEFLREQITTVEVNLARVYNYNVLKK